KPHRAFRGGGDANEAGAVMAELATLESIGTVHPSEFIPPATLQHGVTPKIVTTRLTASVIRTTVKPYGNQNRIPNIRSPGAILAPSGVVFNSNINIHWGEIWTHEACLLVSNWTNHLPVYSPNQDFGPHTGQRLWDPWFRFRTRSVFHDPAGL